MGDKRILHGRYALPADFKAGGMARVYRAADLDDESRIVAVKVLNNSSDERTAAIAFERETKALMRLSHPNIVELLEAGRDPDSDERYLVFEWMPADLGSLMGEPLEWEEYLERVGLPVLRGLAHAHEAQVVHRYLKPANVLLDVEGVPKISDFGIAKIVTDLTPGRTVRSWRSDPYAPKEAEDELNRYSRDVHAFGALSLVILTGVNPDAGFADPYEALEEAQRMLRAPEAFSDLLARCVAKAPEERPADANVALADLEALLLARRRAVAGPAVPTLHLQLLGGVRRYLEEEFDLKPGQKPEEAASKAAGNDRSVQMLAYSCGRLGNREADSRRLRARRALHRQNRYAEPMELPPNLEAVYLGEFKRALAGASCRRSTWEFWQ